MHLTEQKTGTLELPALGGLKLKAPNMAILLLLVVLGSIALPLTAGFVGEFLMIAGLFQQSAWFAAAGGLTMILGAVYMLYAYQRVMLGDQNPAFATITDISVKDYLVLLPLIAIILVLGVFPQPVFNLVEISAGSMQNLLHSASALLPIVY